jgi:hypothetical protein
MLPIVKQPSYTIHLHSVKKKVEYRPYTVGEEKILMMVSQSTDPVFINTNIRKVLQGCILDPDVSISKLASYDVENLLLKIRAKSSGEIVEIDYVDEETKEKKKLEIDLEKIDVTFPEDHEYKIEINAEVGFIMKDLTFDKILSYQEKLSNSDETKKAEVTYDSILDCIESIYDSDKVYTIGDDTTREELETFVGSLSGISTKLYKFMETMPSIQYTFKLDSGKEVTIKDIRNFL